jgi:hypothetical protein
MILMCAKHDTRDSFVYDISTFNTVIYIYIRDTCKFSRDTYAPACCFGSNPDRGAGREEGVPS